MFVIETEKTPAGGKCYHSKFLDITITVYYDKIAIFYDREFHHNKPAAFKKRKEVIRIV